MMKNIILILIAAVYLWFVFIIIYHLIRFGVGTKPKMLALIFFLGSILLLVLTLFAFSQINWGEILGLIKNYFLPQ